MLKEKTVKKRRIRFKWHSTAIIVMLALLAFYSLTLLFMYSWGFITSVKTNEVFSDKPFGLPGGWPWQWNWKNYSVAFGELSVPIYLNGERFSAKMPYMLFNSLMFSLLGPAISLIVTWVVAYLLATFKRPFSKFLYRLNIVLMMIPIIGSLPSALQIYNNLGLHDNWGYVVVSSIGFVGSNLLIFHAYFSSIGNGINEAAAIDGAGNWGIMTKISFPLTIKMFGILFIIAFIARWNDYMTMLIWMPSKPTLAFGLYKLGTSTESDASWPPIQFAGCMILMLPILALFIVFRNKIIGQVTMGALKG